MNIIIHTSWRTVSRLAGVKNYVYDCGVPNARSIELLHTDLHLATSEIDEYIDAKLDFLINNGSLFEDVCDFVRFYCYFDPLVRRSIWLDAMNQFLSERGHNVKVVYSKIDTSIGVPGKFRKGNKLDKLLVFIFIKTMIFFASVIRFKIGKEETNKERVASEIIEYPKLKRVFYHVISETGMMDSVKLLDFLMESNFSLIIAFKICYSYYKTKILKCDHMQVGELTFDDLNVHSAYASKYSRVSVVPHGLNNEHDKKYAESLGISYG
jgi:hypothetical protein